MPANVGKRAERGEESHREDRSEDERFHPLDGGQDYSDAGHQDGDDDGEAPFIAARSYGARFGGPFQVFVRLKSRGKDVQGFDGGFL